jgi:putative sterol carrier protein
MHGRLVADGGPTDVFTIAIRIHGRGSWTARIRGPEMHVREGEVERPTLWMYTTEPTAERFLSDALGPKRLLPKPPPGKTATGVLTMTDPRVLQRIALASGRIELAVVDEEGLRMAIVFGFGDAARRPIAPEDPDTVAEAPLAVLEAVLGGQQGPEDALSSGDVTVRGSRLLALQLALALAPFYPAAKPAEARVHPRSGRW